MDSERGDWTRVAVGILLIVQVILFLVSVSSFMAISVFCSVTAGRSPPLFTIIHVTYLGLFLFGVASLFFWRLGRKIYIAAIIVALMALPVQLWLLDSGYLHCDGP
ncbi:MAG TPA: hypothetical protein VFR60_03710 [Sphingomicrobium sp.]|nr:hypothetical protein [Sphingomicrobium sp.]